MAPPAGHPGPAPGDYPEAEARYRQSLEIDERLGDAAGMASGYHQMGMLAQIRGDYPEAEARYRQLPVATVKSGSSSQASRGLQSGRAVS